MSVSRFDSVFIFVAYAALGIGGSAFSFLVLGGVAFCFLSIAAGRLAPVRDRLIDVMAVAGLAYFLSGCLMVALSGLEGGNLSVIGERLPFLGFLPLYSRLRLTDPDRLRAGFEFGCAAGAAAVAGWAVWELSSGEFAFEHFRASGAPGNSGPYATTAALFYAVCLMAFARRIGALAFLFVTAAGLAGMALVLSGMRTLYPALIAIPIVIAIAFPPLRARLSNPVVAGGLLMVVVGGLLAVWPMVSHRFSMLVSDFDALGGVGGATTSLGQRIALWTCGIGAFLEAPLFGLGRAGGQELLVTCMAEATGQLFPYSHFHNAAITAMASGGLVELIAVGLLMLVPLIIALGARGQDASYGRALLLSILAIYAFNGLTNLMLDHDIHDSIFIYGVTLALTFIVSARTGPVDLGRNPGVYSAVRG